MHALVYRCADIAIHTAQRSLLVGGAAVECETRVFDLLVLLLQQRERVVAKQELVDQLWGGRPVSDASLSQLVYKARKALGDDGAQRQFVQTVHGRGFRWIAAVEVQAAEPVAEAVVAAEADAERVAAVPVQNVSDTAVENTADAAAVTGTPPLRAPAPSRPLARTTHWRGRAALLLLALLAVAAAVLWLPRGTRGPAGAAARLLVLPLQLAPDAHGLDWARLGLMGLISDELHSNAALSLVQNATAQRLDDAVDDSARRRVWRENAGASHSLALQLGRAGNLYRLDALLDGVDGERRRSLFGEDPGRLALDMAGVVRDWLLPRSRGTAAAGLTGEVAQTYALAVDAHLRGEFDVARRYYELCMERRPEALQPRLQLAGLELKYGKAERALALVEEASRRADVRAQPALSLSVQRQLGYVQLQLGRLDAAEAAFGQVAEQAAEADLRSAGLDGLAQVAARRGNYAGAEQWLQQSRALSERAADHLGVAASWGNIGVLERMRGRGDAAEAALLRALAIARERDVPWQQSLFLANLVQLKVFQGSQREALRLGEQALRQLLPPAPRDVRAERVLLLELATARNALGQSAIAQAYATRALALSDEVGDQVMQAIARALLAQVAAATQQPGALALYAAALRDCEQTGQIPRVVYLSAGLARLQRQAGDAAAAQATAQHAQELADAVHNSSLQAYAAAAQAQAEAARGAVDAALARLTDARLQALGAGDRLGAGHLARERARLGLELQRLDAAGAALLELDAENDSAGDALALAEQWRRARGDTAAADALQARRLALDAQLPAEQRFGSGDGAGAEPGEAQPKAR